MAVLAVACSITISFMKIILAVTDSKGKSLVFATDVLKSYSLSESIKLAKEVKLESVHTVKTRQGSYLRTNPNTMEDDNLDTLSLSAYKLFLSLDDIQYFLSEDGWKTYKNYLTLHGRSIEERGEYVIYIDGYPLITKEQVVEKLTPYRELVLPAAKQFFVDPYALGAIAVDEIARAHPWEDALDKLGAVFVGKNTSAGIAQVAIDTAKDLIKRGYYNPNPSDRKLSKENIRETSRAYVYAYVVQPEHSIRFAAARIRYLIDRWAPFVDISKKVEIIGTLYSLPDGKTSPHPHPVSNSRGLQISQEFYPIARTILTGS